ncbi:hypothetical protein L3476_01605 [Paenibacillus thiaminolyticus]|uniref:hypothetical protein n=1 Tax=Paenibacillus thiaminolyticus TaxID=49283 RepID=UPI0023504F61|nr:hypothetical protein [Paenibacillus thiaminolyticus]WCR27502.1 hypothetical protein L3476_01605 [Paenibacillus thiaminolyticus]
MASNDRWERNVPVRHSPVRGSRSGRIPASILSYGRIKPDLIVHPFGVGMFSQAQFDEWVEKARQIARANRAKMIGTSHADGSFRDSEVSLPIAYCIDSSGEDVFISNSDVRSRLLNFDTHDVIIVPDAGEASAGG